MNRLQQGELEQGAIGVVNLTRDISSGAYRSPKTHEKGNTQSFLHYLTPNQTLILAATRRKWNSYGITSDRVSLRPDRPTSEDYACTACIPPPDEQAAIVRYLDHTDELINRYISAKERLIALLEEQRQAVIHQAVTRGTRPERATEAVRYTTSRRDSYPLDYTAPENLAEIRFSNVDNRTRKPNEIPSNLQLRRRLQKRLHHEAHPFHGRNRRPERNRPVQRLQMEDVLIMRLRSGAT